MVSRYSAAAAGIERAKKREEAAVAVTEMQENTWSRLRESSACKGASHAT